MSTNLRAFITAQVNTAFPGVYNIPLASASRFAGVAYQTARNKLLTGSFPLQTVKIGKKRFVSVAALVDFLAAQAGEEVEMTAEPTAEPTKRRRGRPCKNEQRSAA